MKNLLITILLIAVLWHFIGKKQAAPAPAPKPAENDAESEPTPTPTLVQVKEAIQKYFDESPGMLNYISMQIKKNDNTGLTNISTNIHNQFKDSIDYEHVESLVLAKVASFNQLPNSNRLNRRANQKIIFTGMKPTMEV